VRPVKRPIGESPEKVAAGPKRQATPPRQPRPCTAAACRPVMPDGSVDRAGGQLIQALDEPVAGPGPSPGGCACRRQDAGTGLELRADTMGAMPVVMGRLTAGAPAISR
jgi:hypothetical protein